VLGFNLGLGLGLGVRVRVSVSIINKLMVFVLRKAVLPPNGSAGWRSPGIGGRLPAGYPRRLLKTRNTRTCSSIKTVTEALI